MRMCEVCGAPVGNDGVCTYCGKVYAADNQYIQNNNNIPNYNQRRPPNLVPINNNVPKKKTKKQLEKEMAEQNYLNRINEYNKLQSMNPFEQYMYTRHGIDIRYYGQFIKSAIWWLIKLGIVGIILYVIITTCFVK